ncbi:hypothetical protein FOA52_002472 [Chlamydomonas sp. UWO 241]|nr:hypothetical protein FOA52_002472 [Chlamydomonas sp. UWO 241]
MRGQQAAEEAAGVGGVLSAAQEREARAVLSSLLDDVIIDSAQALHREFHACAHPHADTGRPAW